MIDFIKNSMSLDSLETPEGRTNRFKTIVPFVLENTPGNILEIGAGTGMSTKVFLKAASDYSRKVLVIDPWETLPNQPAGYGNYSYEEFLENTKEFNNFLTICKKPSNGKCNNFLDDFKPFAFAFVDGLQIEGEVIHDLYLCQRNEVKVICVDDFNRVTSVSQVPSAVKKFIELNDYKLITNLNNIECYLIR